MEDLDGKTFDEKIYDDCEKCLVLFSRKDCHACKELHPILEDIEQDYVDAGFKFYHVDVDEQKPLFNRFSFKGVPQVLFFDEGNLKGKIPGKKDDDEYCKKIDEILGN